MQSQLRHLLVNATSELGLRYCLRIYASLAANELEHCCNNGAHVLHYCLSSGFLIELFQEGPVFLDEEGNFQNVEGLQHMSIFCLFFTHSLLDLFRYLKVFYIEGLDYLTFALSFIWLVTVPIPYSWSFCSYTVRISMVVL